MDTSSTALHPADGPSFAEVLNEPQLAAVTHPAGPLLVLAGAGSGKTRVISYRIAHLVAVQRVPPYRILAVTFTNKAAREMRSRIEHLVGASIASDLWVGTFHATCARMLRRYHDAVGLQRDFVIYDDADQRALMNRIVKALDLDDRRYPPKLLLSSIHHHKQHGTRPEEVSVDGPLDRIVVQVFSEYQRRLLAANAVDFDDLILHVMRLAEDTSSFAGSELRVRFDHLLVDEFQDVNPIQYRLIRALASDHQNVCVVGDDDQSIYRWRGADVRIIRGFERDFPRTRVVKLEQNYRSTGNVVRAALGVIKPSPDRQAKELFTHNDAGAPVHIVTTRDEREEAAFVTRTIREAMDEGFSPEQIAIFYRIHAQSRVLEEAMRLEDIPYQIVGGTRFFDRTEVKDIMSYLRVIVNPASDVDLMRIINVPSRKIGQATLRRILDRANETQESLYDVIVGDLAAVGLKPAPRKRVSNFAAMMETLRAQAGDLGPREMAERVVDLTGYANVLSHEDSPEADARLENLRELLGSMEEYEQQAQEANDEPSISGYLERVSLVSDLDQVQDVARVSMMTIHAAKGLEFEVVVVTGAEEELFPYQSSKLSRDPGQLEEERRLAYVAFTRARKHLTITHAGSRMIFGTTRYAEPSRFLDDLPQDAVQREPSPWVTSHHQHIPTPASAPHDVIERAPGERYVELDEPSPYPPNDLPLERGTHVVHKRYGEGVVAELDLSKNPPLARVVFPAWGERKIALRFLQPA